jgi:hypothetical protein
VDTVVASAEVEDMEADLAAVGAMQEDSAGVEVDSEEAVTAEVVAA